MIENSTAIEASNLSKTFSGGVAAVSGLDLSVPHGVVYGLVGRNGAGKTTLIRMLMGLLRPTGGHGRILGRDLWHSDPSHRQCIGYVSQTHKAATPRRTKALRSSRTRSLIERPRRWTPKPKRSRPKTEP